MCYMFHMTMQHSIQLITSFHLTKFLLTSALAIFLATFLDLTILSKTRKFQKVQLLEVLGFLTILQLSWKKVELAKYLELCLAPNCHSINVD